MSHPHPTGSFQTSSGASKLSDLASRYGIAPGFKDNWGQYHEATEAELAAILAAMGVDVGAGTAGEKAGEPQSEYVIPPIVFCQQGQPVRLNFALATGNSRISWKISSAPDNHQCSVDPELVCSGTSIAAANLQAGAIITIEPREPLSPGYFNLQVDQESSHTPVELTLVVFPPTAFKPTGDSRMTGVSTQLYSLRSDRNWGIGDFTDLKQLATTLADFGVDAIGLNPLHCLYLHHPERCSPYSPSSRLFFNPVYLDVMSAPGIGQCDAAWELLATAAFKADIDKARSSSGVDYVLVSNCKMRVLRELHQYFVQLPATDTNVSDYRYWTQQQGVALQLQARFEAFDQHFSTTTSLYSTLDWPEALQDPHSRESEALAKRLSNEIDFSCYLQWLCALQLESVAQYCREIGLSLGLYFDLAVGVDINGAEPWSDREAFANGVHIGAPPDSLGPMGQDWSLAPYRPNALRTHAYKPFIEMLRANMADAGALRIDHVMGLMRQYWCIPELSQSSGSACGTYVDFPFDDLLALAILESHRNQCMLIGEDLGTVPGNLRERLDEAGILRYRVLYFEKDYDSGEFRSPAEYPGSSLATAATHDLPTLAGFWNGHDLDCRAQLGLFPDSEYETRQRSSRHSDRQHLLDLFRQQGVVPELVEACDESISSRQFADAVHLLMAKSPSRLLVLQLEDLVGQVDMVNMPGTVYEHPNWCRKLEISLEELPRWLRSETVLAQVIEERRDAGQGGSTP